MGSVQLSSELSQQKPGPPQHWGISSIEIRWWIDMIIDNEITETALHCAHHWRLKSPVCPSDVLLHFSKPLVLHFLYLWPWLSLELLLNLISRLVVGCWLHPLVVHFFPLLPTDLLSQEMSEYWQTRELRASSSASWVKNCLGSWQYSTNNQPLFILQLF